MRRWSDEREDLMASLLSLRDRAGQLLAIRDVRAVYALWATATECGCATAMERFDSTLAAAGIRADFLHSTQEAADEVEDNAGYMGAEHEHSAVPTAGNHSSSNTNSSNSSNGSNARVTSGPLQQEQQQQPEQQ